tara:strand:- start:4105 stop:5022 length:918 start_codon:yes stop_codon:yes gene_type:complete
MVLNTDEKYEARIKSMRDFTYDWKPENADDPSKPILKISKSSLVNSFGWCNKKYEFAYIQRLPTDQTEAMRKGTILHNYREDFFNEFDIKKAEAMNNSEVLEYCTSLMPIDEYYDLSLTVAAFEAQRFIEARSEERIDEFLPVVNEKAFDCEITVPKNVSKKYPLQRDYVVRLQGIIDRVFIENGKLIPFEYKTGSWKDSKASSMRQEMAFYQLMIENAPEEVLEKHGLTKDMEVSHWGWYYPMANHITVEPVKKRSMTALWDNIAKLIYTYEQEYFPATFYMPTCSQYCSYYGICEAAQNDSWL